MYLLAVTHQTTRPDDDAYYSDDLQEKDPGIGFDSESESRVPKALNLVAECNDIRVKNKIPHKPINEPHPNGRREKKKRERKNLSRSIGPVGTRRTFPIPVLKFAV